MRKILTLICIVGLCVTLFAGCDWNVSDAVSAIAGEKAIAKNNTAETEEIEETPAQTTPLQVACVGDSNTEGFDEKNYPAVLGELLGEGYVVTNYGASGAAAMHGISASYDDTDMYTQSISSSPDIVVIMFGTNDSAAWKDEAAFAADYEKLISTYAALDSKPRVFLCTPPAPHLEKAKEGSESKVQPDKYEQINKVIKDAAKLHDLPLVDIYELTKEKPDWYIGDGIHLNEYGSRLVAKTVANTIQK